MSNRKALVILLTIAILVVSATTVIASSRRNGKPPETNEQWEKLYVHAGDLINASLQTRDESTRQQLWKQAAKLYEEALKLAPDEVNTWNNLAATLYLVDDKDRAFDVYTALIQAHPEVSSAYMGRGRIYEERGEKRMALQDYTTYLSLIADRPGDAANKQRIEFQKLIDSLKDQLKEENDLQPKESINTDIPR